MIIYVILIPNNVFCVDIVRKIYILANWLGLKYLTGVLSDHSSLHYTSDRSRSRSRESQEIEMEAQTEANSSRPTSVVTFRLANFVRAMVSLSV